MKKARLLILDFGFWMDWPLRGNEEFWILNVGFLILDCLTASREFEIGNLTTGGRALAGIRKPRVGLRKTWPQAMPRNGVKVFGETSSSLPERQPGGRDARERARQTGNRK
jgi:hypothetical protein